VGMMNTLDSEGERKAKQPMFIIRMRLTIAVLLLILSAISAYNLVYSINVQRQYRNDLSEINNIKYGLLNAEIWANVIYNIVSTKIDEFEVNAENRVEIEAAIAKIIDQIIVKIEEAIRKQNSESDRFFGRLIGSFKQSATNFLIDIREIRQHVPEYTNIVFTYLNKPGARGEIKQLIKEKLYELNINTFSVVNKERYNIILNRYGCSDQSTCNNAMKDIIISQEIKITKYTILTFTFTIMLLCILLIKNPRIDQYQVLILIMSCLILLISGVISPMIEIGAKISELNLKLFGEDISFNNQVMYYQSKSLFDVVSILVVTGRFKLILVGMLLFIFSITFPLLKLISSLIYFYDIRGYRNKGFVKFFALKSGKWSMADVMVLAIFMAYVGFDGIITSQLSRITEVSRQINIFTTGGSQLQTGFYLFLGFCIDSLILSSVLENRINS
jgi:hypothetical protein